MTAGAAFAQEANLPAEVRTAIAEMDPKLNPEVIASTRRLMGPLQASLAGQNVNKDIVYGPGPAQKLDVYPPQGATAPAPVVLFVHGGGFRQGTGYGEQAAAFFARHWMLGVKMNLRPAPR